MADEVGDSILSSIKKMCQVSDDDTSFDVDIMVHINSVFADLQQLGIGPDAGFMIDSAAKKWVDYVTNDFLLNSVKSYMYLRVRLLFDPPSSGFAITAMEKQIEKMEWRLNVKREGEQWMDPNPVVVDELPDYVL